MMKIILSMSLILNLILGYLVLTRNEEKPPVERIIIETHPKKEPLKMEEKVKPSSAVKLPKEEKKEDAPPEFSEFMPSEFQEAGEKMEHDRTDYFIQKLGFSEEQVNEHNRLRLEYFQQTSEMWPKDSMRELTFEERRKLIDLEENFHKKLEKLHGKKNWENYQKFREKYNEQGFKLQNEENRPFVFMGI